MSTGLELAMWLESQPIVKKVLHPGLPSNLGHSIWQRDFRGSSGLFGVVLQPTNKHSIAAMLDHMELFKMGYSWGGYESLIIPTSPSGQRTATNWDPSHPTLRIHAGLEDPEDLQKDLEDGLQRLENASGC